MPSNINETESEAPVSTRADKYRLQTQLNDLKQHADKIIQGIKKLAPIMLKELFGNYSKML
ncbi:MAG: hypothetical protein M0D57_08470 [Sphingobacteriales bacterium JAD_PAG50586_3]|nr:MAG: hypothetical protein M0D57_08470 [Sphingobacteriales bacterium JAD_PAG50586_3]